MVSEPSGLLTCLQRLSARRTRLRIVGAWALGLGWVFIALQNAVASDHTILVLGACLSAALGIRPEQGWVALLAQRLQTQGYGYQIVNASVSGETTSGGLERLPRALQLHQPGTECGAQAVAEHKDRVVGGHRVLERDEHQPQAQRPGADDPQPRPPGRRPLQAG